MAWTGLHPAKSSALELLPGAGVAWGPSGLVSREGGAASGLRRSACRAGASLGFPEHWVVSKNGDSLDCFHTRSCARRPASQCVAPVSPGWHSGARQHRLASGRAPYSLWMKGRFGPRLGLELAALGFFSTRICADKLQLRRPWAGATGLSKARSCVTSNVCPWDGGSGQPSPRLGQSLGQRLDSSSDSRPRSLAAPNQSQAGHPGDWE